MEKKCGIYKITNKFNNDCYIGKSIDIDKRWYQHKNRYNDKNSKSYNYYLYRAFRKYGIENFKFEILELCSPEELIEIETKYYNIYNPIYCMQSPKQDFKCFMGDWKQKCRERWIKRSRESKEKALINLSKYKGGRINKTPIIAIHISTQKEIMFDSLYSAEKQLEISRSSISQILNPNHNRKSAKGYTFKRLIK